MTTATTDRLMNLLPAVYRLRDVDKRGPLDRDQLRKLLSIIAGQVDLLDEDLAQLYDDQFIDTCADWVIPYIGDLLGTSPLYAGNETEGDTARSLFPDLLGPRFAPRVALRGRADVARTIYFRKRKATLPMLEELANAVTGWAAHVVEFFELLIWNQCIRNHVRLHSKGTVDLRKLDALDRIQRPFDTASHTVDVAPISQHEGWHEVRNIGFFLWRLRSYAIDGVDARADLAAGAFAYRFHPLGLDTPLFSPFVPTLTGGLTETTVPSPIRPRLLEHDLANDGTLYTDAFSIALDGVAVPRERICSADLSAWAQPADDTVAVDTRTGRIALGATIDVPSRVEVAYHYGFSSDLGGGTYARSSWKVKSARAEAILSVRKDGTGDATTVAGALALWDRAKNTIIEIADNRTYEEGALTLDVAEGKWLAIEAADRKRPTLILSAPIEVPGVKSSSVTLGGLLIEGRVHVSVPAGEVRVIHTTLLDGVDVDEVVNDDVREDPLRLEVAFSIVGPLRVPQTARGIWLLDSIVDGTPGDAIAGPAAGSRGARAWIERSTLFGPARVLEMTLATETIFTAQVNAERRQSGCIRFSYVPPGSRTPRRYRCQPDLSEEADRPSVVPSFTSLRYGEPAYAQLHLNGPRVIARGAEDSSEMGVFCHLKQPQREDNLRLRLIEFLPFGLQPGLIFVT